MPRAGQNPMKWEKNVHHPERITSTTIVHIPFLEGYWKHGLDVLRLCLQSMRQSTQLPFDMMVLDNGSCQEVQDFLQDLHQRGEIQFLILSEHNLGKVGAFNVLFSAAPGEIITYCDSDMYFLPSWLEESLEILEVFPEAGMVTAVPIAGGDISSLMTAQKARLDPSISIKEGVLIPEEYLNAHLVSIGAAGDEYDRRQANRKDVLLTRGSTQAYATASHFQFTTTRRAVSTVIPCRVDGFLEGATAVFDESLEAAGHWRLSTTKYLVHHMGNRVPDLRAELPWLENAPDINAVVEPPRLRRNHKRSRHGLLQSTAVRKTLKKLNTLSYRLLYDE